jgi:hypothetical protein
MVAKRNSRNAFVGEPIRLSFFMRNPLRGDIEVSGISVKVRPTVKVNVAGESSAVSLPGFRGREVAFTLTPTETGLL